MALGTQVTTGSPIKKPKKSGPGLMKPMSRKVLPLFVEYEAPLKLKPRGEKNDSGSFWETFFSPRGLSFSGASYSTNKGRTFRDIGFINPGPDFFGFLMGDPVVTCVPSAIGGQPSVFYYTQIFSENRVRLAEIAISKSTDG